MSKFHIVRNLMSRLKLLQAKVCARSTVKLAEEKSVVRWTDCPNMTIAVVDHVKARFVLLVDLREFLFRPRVGGGGGGGCWLVIFRAFFFFQSFFFSELRFLFILEYLQKNSNTSKVIFKYYIIFLKIWTGQSLLTVSFSKMHRQNLKKILLNIIFFNQTNNI